MKDRHTEVPYDRLRRYACRDAGFLYQEMNLPSEGFGEERVSQMRRQYGANCLEGDSKPNFFSDIKRAFVNPFSIVLFVLACVSFAADNLLYSDSHLNAGSVGIILAMLLISGGIRLLQERKASRTAAGLMRQIDAEVLVLRGGELCRVPAQDLVVGDQVQVMPGDRIPADLRIVQADNLFVSQSLLTGESTVLEKKVDTVQEGDRLPLTGFSNLLFMGSSVIGGNGKGVVLAVGQQTVYGECLAAIRLKKRGFDAGADSIAKVLVRFMTALVPLVFLASGITKGDWMTAFLFSLSVAVGLTPELLPMVINACLAKGSAAMGKKQTIVKNINAMQSFGGMDLLCLDKTGTLTGDELVLEYFMDLFGNESGKVLDAAYLNSLYHSGLGSHLDGTILKSATQPSTCAHFSAVSDEWEKLDELPFDYVRKCASVLVRDKTGNRWLITKGSVQSVYGRCSFVRCGGQSVPVDPGDTSSVQAIVGEMTEDGMKVLAVAVKQMQQAEKLEPEDEHELTLIGYLAFFDAPKRSASAALEKLRLLKVQPRVLTGDELSVTLSICRRLGIPTDSTLTGNQLESLSPDERMLAIERTAVFAELTPQQKAAIVQQLHQNGHTVGFLGDGMNDIAAMAAADVGISVDTAAEAAKEAADVILLKKDLNVLEQGILEGRSAFANMSKYVRITASSNFGNIIAVLVASVFLPFLPMTAVQLLLLNLLYDILCMTIPWDRVDAEILCKPISWSGKTLGRFMRFFGPLSTFFDLLTFAFLFFLLCPAITGGNYYSLSAPLQEQFAVLFHTGWFLESLWTQVLILHMLRTAKIPFVQSRASGMVWAVTSAGLIVLTAVVFTPAAQKLGLAPLPAIYFVFLFAAVASYMLLVTVAKRWYIHKYKDLL